MREGDNAFLVEQLEVYFGVNRTCWGQRNANKRNNAIPLNELGR